MYRALTLYILGFLILMGGLIYGAAILHVAAQWITMGATVLPGLALFERGASYTGEGSLYAAGTNVRGSNEWLGRYSSTDQRTPGLKAISTRTPAVESPHCRAVPA